MMVIGGAFLTMAVEFGLGRRFSYLSIDQVIESGKYMIFMLSFTTASIMIGRISFCVFLLRAIGTEPIVQILLWCCIVTQALVNGVAIILNFSECGLHMDYIWNLAPTDPLFIENCID